MDLSIEKECNCNWVSLAGDEHLTAEELNSIDANNRLSERQAVLLKVLRQCTKAAERKDAKAEKTRRRKRDGA